MWHGHAPVHLDRRVPGLIRRHRRLAATVFRHERGAFAMATRDARDVEDVRRGVEEAQRASKSAWLAYYRRCVVDVGAQFARQGLPAQVRSEAWGPSQDDWWVNTYLQRLGPEEWWDPWLAGMLRYAEHTAATRVRHIDAVTQARVAAVIREGVAEGVGVAVVRDRIEDLYVGFSKVRAGRIAQTEVLNSARAGSFEAVIATGLSDVAVKSWRDSGDVLVRETHRVATAENVGIPYLEPFQVRNPRTGAMELLNFPGDASLGASAANIINCRCDLFAESKR